MIKETIAILNLRVENITGEKNGKEYDFNTLTLELGDLEFTLYPKESDKKLLNYLIEKEIEERD